MVIDGGLWRHLRYRISVMSHSVLIRELRIRESVVICVSNSRLSEVNHGRAEFVTDESHARKISYSSSQTMASGLHCVLAFELFIKALYFS